MFRIDINKEMNKTDVEKEQSHWFLAKMGKKVLRPGGRELTERLIEFLEVNPKDEVVEFAPGLGDTAKLVLHSHPKSYVGVEREEEHIQRLQKKLKGDNVRFIQGNAAHTGLASESVNKVFGEAMLSMHADHRKIEIISEAARLLKKGGWYAIHELELRPADMPEEQKAEIKKDLAVASRVNARPLNILEWKELLESQGFKILKMERKPMRLLEPSRLIDDEGLLGTLKIGFNVITTPKAKKRINELRKVFKKHKGHINALAILAEKI